MGTGCTSLIFIQSLGFRHPRSRTTICQSRPRPVSAVLVPSTTRGSGRHTQYRSIRGIQPVWGRLSGSRERPRPTANNSHESLSSAGILGSRSQPIILLMSTNLPTLSTFELGTRNGISPKPGLESLVPIKQPQAHHWRYWGEGAVCQAG